MFKLVVLFAAVAMAAAKPGLYAPSLAYSSVVPAVGAVPAVSAVPAVRTVPAVNAVPALYQEPLYTSPSVLPSYRYQPQYYNPSLYLNGYNGVAPAYYGPEVVAARSVPYVAATPYHQLFKRSDEKKSN